MSEYSRLVIAVDSSQVHTADQDLSLLERQAGRTESAVVKMAKQAAGAFAGFKLAEQAKNAVTLAARYDQLGLVMQTVGRNTGRSVVELEALDQVLRETGISSLQSRNNIIKMMSANIDLAQASKLARLAQDAAVIANTDSSEAFERLIRGIQSAEKETLESMGLNVSFSQSYEKLAAQLGKNADQLTTVEKTQAGVNAVLEAGANIAGSYEASMENVLKQAGSLKRPLQDLMVLLGGAWQSEFGAGVNLSAVALEFLNKNADATAQTIKTGLYASFALASVALGKKTLATISDSQVTLKSSADQLKLAQAHVASTSAALAQAKANVGLTISTGQVAAATKAHEAAQKNLTAAQISSVTVSKTLSGLVGGLPGLAVTAGLVALSFIDWKNKADEAKTANIELSGSVDDLINKWRELGDAQRTQMQSDLLDTIRSTEQEIKDLAGKVEQEFYKIGNADNLPFNDWISPLKAFSDEVERGGKNIDGVSRELIEAAGAGEEFARTVKSSAAEIEKKSGEVAKAEQALKRMETQTHNSAAANRELASTETDVAGSKWLASLQQRADFAGNLTEVQRVNIAIEKQYAGVLSDPDQKIARANAAIIDRENAIKATIKPLNDSKKAFQDFIAQSQLTTVSLTAMAAAYMDGADSVRELMIEQKVEEQLLKTGASARSAVTKAVQELQDAEDKRDIAKQISSIRQLNKDYQSQLVVQLANSKSVAEGMAAQRKYNIEKQLAVLLAGKSSEALAKETKELKKQLAQQEDLRESLESYGEISRLIDSTATSQEKLNRKMADLNRLMAEAKTPEQILAIQRAMKEAQREASQWAKWTESALERVDSAFADAWRNIGDGFSGFRDNLTNAFKQMLAELAHMAITKPIIMQFGSMLGVGGGTQGNNGIWGSMLGGGNSGAGGGINWGQMASYGQSAYSALTGWGPAAMAGYQSGGLMGGIQGVGSYYGGVLGGAANTVAGWFGAGGGAAASGTGFQLGGSLVSGGVGNASYASSASGLGSMLSSAMPYLAIITGMIQSGKLYDQGVRPDASAMAQAGGNTLLGKGMGWTQGGQSAFFKGLDGILSPVVGGKVAAMLTGSTFHQALWTGIGGKLFGGSWQTKSGGLSLGVKDGDFAGQQYIDQKKKGGLFSSNKKRTRYSALDADTAATLKDAYDATEDSVAALYEQLGYTIDDATLNGLAIGATKISTMGKSGEQIEEAIGKWLGTVAEGMNTELNKVFVIGLDYDLDGMRGFVGNMLGVNETLRYLDVAMYSSDVAGGKLAETLSELAGGLDVLSANASTYYDNFFSAEEKAADTMDAVTRAFEEADVTLAGSREQYRSMIEDIDLTTEAGQEMFAKMMALSGHAAEYFSIVERQAAEANAKAQQAVAELMGDANSAYSMLQRSVSAERNRLTQEFNLKAKQEQEQASQHAKFAAAYADRLQNQVGISQTLITALQNIDKALESALERLRGTSSDVVAFRREQSMDLLRDALALARSGVSLNDVEGLTGALDVAATLDSGTYNTLEAFKREQGHTSNLIADLQALNGKQLTAEELLLERLKANADAARESASLLSSSVNTVSEQLQEKYNADMAALDAELASAALQMDALNGIDNSILSVGVAVERMSAAIVAAVNGQAGLESGKEETGVAATIKRLYESILGYTADKQGVRHWSDRLAGGETLLDMIDALKRQSQTDVLGKVPAFASGGFHSGGLRLVGENGPELEVTGPSRIHSASQTAAMLGGGNGAEMRVMAQAIQSLQQAVEEQGHALRAIAKHTHQTARRVEMLERWDFDGLPGERTA